MWDWIIVIFCFVCVALARTYLFKKSYQKKMKYYTHPMDLAKEVLQEQRKKQTEIMYQNSIKIERLAELIGYNLGCSARIINQTIPNLEEICEKLRNMALYVCVIKTVHEQNKPALDENLKIIGAVVGPHLDVFAQIRKYIETQNDDPKLKKKRDQYLDKSVENYIQHLIEDLSQYMVGY